MTDMTNKTDMTGNAKKKGGYESLVVYWLGTTIYDMTVVFTKTYIGSLRTREQMDHAARSGKQNIVEGSLENSVEGNLKLTGVAKASYGELLEDFKDYLRQHNLNIWDKNDPRVLVIRKTPDQPNTTYQSNKTYMSYINTPERYANMMITLCYKQSYLLFRLLVSIEDKFVKEGGFRENLFKKRREYQKNL